MDTVILIFKIIGTIAFAISGALAGMKKHMDIFGTCVLGVTTAVGGGMIRDSILGLTPVDALVHPEYLLLAAIVSIIVFLPFVSKQIYIQHKTFDIIFLIADSIGLGTFTAYGFMVAVNNGFSDWFLLIFVSVITGVGGGVMRDIFALQEPLIFVKHIYAIAAIIGAIACYFINLYVNINIAVIVCFAVIFVIRILSAIFRWKLPKASLYEEQIHLK